MLSPDDILFEDNHLIAINKKPGDISQGDKTGDVHLGDKVKEYLKFTYSKSGNVYLGLLHRLDRPVSGVMLFAKTSKAAERLSSDIQQKKWQKIYWAITDAKPPETAATLHHYLVKQESLNKSFVCQPDTKGAKEALLKYRIRGMGTTLTCLEIELLTGRHHQIRVQLAHIGCTVRGDLKYGARRSALKGSIYLHARSLHLVHPVQKTPLIIEAPTPDDPVWNLFK